MTEKKQIEKRIREEIETTSQLVDQYKGLTQPIAPENAIGRVSRMDAINNKSINQVALRNAEVKLKNLQAALSRIDESDFGICIKCNQPIPLGRILLRPQSMSCVRCAV